MNKENCALKLDDEITLYYDAWSKKHQNILLMNKEMCIKVGWWNNSIKKFGLAIDVENYLLTPLGVRAEVDAPCRGPVAMRSQLLWDLWWTQWYRDRFSTVYFGPLPPTPAPVSVPYPYYSLPSTPFHLIMSSAFIYIMLVSVATACTVSPYHHKRHPKRPAKMAQLV